MTIAIGNKLATYTVRCWNYYQELTLSLSDSRVFQVVQWCSLIVLSTALIPLW